ncbi:hypothetical protein BC628DRAFT_998245 [Trametes gibbosa]|nr:hypothetical protein BC628DRAFT_998245 [Trametes gibbosa]
MSDTTTNVPLDPGTSSSFPNPNSNGSDAGSTSTGSTDPNSPNPNAGFQPNTGASTPPDPTTGTPDGGVPPDGPNQGSPLGSAPGNGLNNPVPPANTTPLLPSSITVGSGLQPSPSPNVNALPDNGTPGGNVPQSLGGKSDDHTKTIIIASSVSGGVAVILALLVLLFVYRRRRRTNKRRLTAFVDAMPNSNHRDSDATWIGPKARLSFDESKLEAGNRNSDSSMGSDATTLADFAGARAKSGGFSTPSHTPKPSLDKINTHMEPMVSEDPFEKPRLSIADQARASLDKVAQPVPAPRRRKSGAPTIRINSNSTFSSVEIQKGDVMGLQSPGSPMLPLFTPISPPPSWHGNQSEYMRAPTRRDSMVSLSRQSSKASSRNSFILDEPDATQRAKRTSKFAAIAKKRRSRADSIDPFRKSNTTMVSAARRKSRAGSVASSRRHISGSQRKSRAESVAPPTTPGGRRKSRAGSIAPPMTPRRKSQASHFVTSPTSAIFASPVEFVGLPRTPRTPTAIAARRSRAAEQMPRPPAQRAQSLPREYRGPPQVATPAGRR